MGDVAVFRMEDGRKSKQYVPIAVSLLFKVIYLISTYLAEREFETIFQ